MNKRRQIADVVAAFEKCNLSPMVWMSGRLWAAIGIYPKINYPERRFTIKSKIWIASEQHLIASGRHYSVKDWNTDLNKTIVYGTPLNLYAHFQDFLKSNQKYEKRRFPDWVYMRRNHYDIHRMAFKAQCSSKIRHYHCPGCHYFYYWPGSWYNLWLS